MRNHPTIRPCDVHVSSGPIITKKARLFDMCWFIVWLISQVNVQDNKVCRQSTLVRKHQRLAFLDSFSMLVLEKGVILVDV